MTANPKISGKASSFTKPLGFVERVAYGTGDMGCNVIYTAIYTFLLIYYTDYAGVSAAAVGTIMLVSRVLDGFTDLAMGVVVDRTRTRWGKARPWLLRMAVPFALGAVLMFSVPASWGSTAKLVYVFITYNIVTTFLYTAINVPYSALNALMTQNPYERSVLSIYRNLFATMGTLIINTVTLKLVSYFGDTPTSWTKAFMILGAFATLLFLFCFLFTKERVHSIAEYEGNRKDIPVMDGIKALFKNKYWVQMAIILLLYFAGMFVIFGATTYFAKYILNDVHMVTPIGNYMTIAQILLMLTVLAYVIKRLGKRNTMILGSVFLTLGLVILLFNQSTPAVLASSVVRGIGNACFGATMWAMVSDTIDYGEWKTGLRTEGLVNSASSFSYKIGSGLGSAILGWILSIGGFDGMAAEQSDSAIAAIRFCFIVLPIIFYALTLFILYFYHLDDEFPGVIKDLRERAKLKTESEQQA